ncbi:MAG: trypco2 family protein [Kribbellaceae bacterium]
MSEDLTLGDAIDQLRRELSEAVRRGQGQEVQFELGAVTMEFEVALSTSVEGNAGARFWVVSVGGSAARSGTNTHRLAVELTPVVGGQANPRISRRELARER